MWQIWYFCHICWHCLWHWYRLHGTKSHHSWLCFGNFQMWNVDFSQARWEIKRKTAVCRYFCCRSSLIGEACDSSLVGFSFKYEMWSVVLSFGIWILLLKKENDARTSLREGSKTSVMARKLAWRNFVYCEHCNNSVVIFLLILSGKIVRQVSAFLCTSVLCVCHSWSSWYDFSMAW